MDRTSDYSYAWPCALIGVVGIAAVLLYFYYETEEQRRAREEEELNSEIRQDRLRKAEEAKQWLEEMRAAGIKID